MHKKYILLSFVLIAALSSAATDQLIDINDQLNQLEAKYHRKIGLYAFDSNSKKTIAYNENKCFPFQSTFKLLGVSALLYQHQKAPVLSDEITIRKSDIIPWGPMSHQYLNKSVSYKILCEAAISQSDNTAINLIIRKLGGIVSINKFARTLGISPFSLNHIENHLNSNLENSADTSSPKAVSNMITTLLNSNILTVGNKCLLKQWLTQNTTGYNHIRAGMLPGWSVADKTGSGQYGVANDLAIAWSPACKPVVLSIYTVGSDKSLLPNSQLISEITNLTMSNFSKLHSCYQLTDLSKVFNYKI